MFTIYLNLCGASIKKKKKKRSEPSEIYKIYII